MFADHLNDDHVQLIHNALNFVMCEQLHYTYLKPTTML